MVESWVQGQSESLSQIEKRLRSLAYSECITFFPTDRERRIAAGFSSKFLSSKAMADFYEKSVVRSQGIPAKRISSYANEVNKYDKFTCVFSARFNSNKQWDKILEVYEDIFRMGRDVQIKAVATTASPADLDKRFSKVEFIPTQSYEDYVDLISRSHVAVSMSLDEGFSFGWSEHICTGNPVLLPNKSWALGLVDDKYPYLYNSEVELIAMLKWVYDNYEEAREKMSKYADYFVSTHDIQTAADDILSRVSDTMGESWAKLSLWDSKFSEALESMPESFTFSYFIDFCEKKYKASFGLFTPAYLAAIGSYRNIYKWLRDNAEIVLSEDMTFRRV